MNETPAMLRKAAWQQRDFVTNRLINPFLRVMKAHNNPGAEQYEGIGLGWDLSLTGEATVFRVNVNGHWHYAVYTELNHEPDLLSSDRAPISPIEHNHVDIIRDSLQSMLELYNLPSPF
jgi:hypothetical protein